MLRTRNSYKRSSSDDNRQNKKTKLGTYDSDLEDNDEEDGDIKNDFDDNTDEDSDYKPKKDDKSSESEDSDDETESKFFKSSNKRLATPKSSSKNLANFVEKYKRINTPSSVLSKATPKKDIKKETIGHNLESDSSSDEFERVPISLEELGDFKKINPAIKKENNAMTTSDNSDDDVNDANKVQESDYFDFTQIIQRQELIKSVAMMKNENDKKAEIEKRSKSEIDSTKEINKKYIRRKVNRSCKKQGTENERNDLKSSDMNVMELLKLGEGSSKIGHDDNDRYEDNSDDDTEVLNDESKPKNIQVTIELPGVERKKDKKKTDIEAAIKRRFNLIKKENQIYAHKVHVLCWIAHGNYLNDVLNSTELMGIALSLIPSKHCYPPKRCDLHYLEKLVEWFTGKVEVIKDAELEKIHPDKNLHKSLEEQFMKHVAYSRKDLALLFVCVVRALGLTARLIINLRPVPLKPPVHELISISNKTVEGNKKGLNKTADKNQKSKDESKNSTKKPKINSSKYFSKNKNNSKTIDTGDKKDTKKLLKSGCSDEKKDSLNREIDIKGKPSTSSESRTSERKQPLRGKKNVDNMNGKSSKSTNDSKKMLRKHVDYLYTDSGNSENEDDGSDDSDNFIPKSKPKQNRKSSKDKKIDRRVLSTDDENDKDENPRKKKKNTVDEWAEVFLEAEEKWISVDLIRRKIHCTQHLYSAATPPVTYVLGWENNHSIKDLTRRYVPHWMTVTRRQRAEPEWWEETIRPYAPPNNARNREEDEELDKQLEDQPLPSSISEYKNHPLYALKRHLLKFQAIYPPDAPTVGFIKSEPVYSRTCVVELHTRESWIKEAKLVRVGQEPYKIVKARPKYDKMTGAVIKDLPLNLYGYWQVEDYIPPPAVDGKVPRNEYGNVELYKPCMLPAGTVHLQLPGLNRVAKKLDIDCAPAVVGWDFHGGGSHPVMDGFVVCEEFKDKLLDAWNREIDESAKRAREKVEQRVYGNWRRVIKGLLIREKLKLRYGFEEVPQEKQAKKKQPAKKSTKK